MKRIASFVLAVLLILSLCACSLPQAKPAEEPTDELELVEEAAEAAEAEAPVRTAPAAPSPFPSRRPAATLSGSRRMAARSITAAPGAAT